MPRRTRAAAPTVQAPVRTQDGRLFTPVPAPHGSSHGGTGSDPLPTLPTAGEKAALAGTAGSPSGTNRYVTNADTRNTDARTPLAHVHAAADVTSGVLSIDRIPVLTYAKLPTGGGTWTLGGDLTLSGGKLLFSPDNTHDIGALGATRPKDIYAGSNVRSPNFIGGNASFETSVACDSTDGQASPVYGLQTVGDTTHSRFTRAQNQDDFALTVNLWTVYFGGIQWWLDDTSKTGLRFRSRLGTGWTWGIATAGTNPRTVTDVATLSPAGALTLSSGLTLNGPLILTTDATYDIGAAGATRPRDLFLSRYLKAGDAIFERGRTIALGDPQNVTYDSTNFSSATGTWAVESADQYYYAYAVIGKVMVLFFDIRGSTTSGSGTYLKIKVPGGYTVGSPGGAGPRIPVQVYDGAWSLGGLATAFGGETSVRIYRNVSADAWPDLTNSIAAIGTIIFPLQ